MKPVWSWFRCWSYITALQLRSLPKAFLNASSSSTQGYVYKYTHRASQTFIFLNAFFFVLKLQITGHGLLPLQHAVHTLGLSYFVFYAFTGRQIFILAAFHITHNALGKKCYEQ